MKIETKLINLLENHDWWAFMSDDPSVDKRARDNWIEILQLMRDFPNREVAFELYKKHCPERLFDEGLLVRKSIGL